MQLEAPGLGWYRPALHAVQLDEPDAEAYDPAGQLVHALDPAKLYWPAKQGTQTLERDAPVVADENPAPQIVQLDAPASGWY